MILERLNLDEPKTKEMARILTVLGVDSSALITTSELKENIVKSTRNLPRIKTIPANLLNVIDLLSHKRLLMTEAEVNKVEQLWGKSLS
jgi:large subunit ribosomal protein L4